MMQIGDDAFARALERKDPAKAGARVVREAVERAGRDAAARRRPPPKPPKPTRATLSRGEPITSHDHLQLAKAVAKRIRRALKYEHGQPGLREFLLQEQAQALGAIQAWEGRPSVLDTPSSD